MAKFKPGIPDTFSLNVEPVTDLGDYLDEPRPLPPPVRKAREEVEAQPPAQPVASVANPVNVDVPVTPPPVATATPPVVPQTVVVPVAEAAVVPQPAALPPVFSPSVMATNAVPVRDEPEREERGGKEKAPRREISMTPEALRMSDELLEVIRNGSGQRDTKANELMHALVLLAHDVIDNIDPHTIPKRGRWGSPTARAYPVELRNAFLRALLEKYGQGADGAGGLQYPVNTAV